MNPNIGSTVNILCVFFGLKGSQIRKWGWQIGKFSKGVEVTAGRVCYTWATKHEANFTAWGSKKLWSDAKSFGILWHGLNCHGMSGLSWADGRYTAGLSVTYKAWVW